MRVIAKASWMMLFTGQGAWDYGAIAWSIISSGCAVQKSIQALLNGDSIPFFSFQSSNEREAKRSASQWTTIASGGCAGLAGIHSWVGIINRTLAMLNNPVRFS